MTLISEPKETVSVRVKAKGFDLFYYTLFDKKKEVTLDVQAFAAIKKGSVLKYFFELTGNPHSLLQSKDPMSVISYSDDTLSLSFDQIGAKKVPVTGQIYFDVDTSLNKVTLLSRTPDSVVVKGSKLKLAKLKEVQVDPLFKVNSKKSGFFNVPLLNDGSWLKMIPDSIQVEAAIEEIKTFELEVPIRCTGKPDDLKIKFFPAVAVVSFSTTEEQFKRLSKKDFSVQVPFSDIHEGEQRVFISLEAYPDFIQSPTVSPGKVEFIIK